MDNQNMPVSLSSISVYTITADQRKQLHHSLNNFIVIVNCEKLSFLKSELVHALFVTSDLEVNMLTKYDFHVIINFVLCSVIEYCLLFNLYVIFNN